MPEIVFPPSTAPSRNIVENGGRVINAYAEIAPEGSRSKYRFRRAPGLRPVFTAGTGVPRGAWLVGSLLHVVNGDKVYTVSKAGNDYTVTALSGTIGGTGPVTIAHNMRSPTAQILIVHSSGMSQVASSTVSDFTDPDLPSVVSITFMDGYFIVTAADGRAFSSDLNDDEFGENNFATAEAATDGLVRGIAVGRDLLLMGESTIEFWGNAGNPTGFPFSRGPVMSIGLKGRFAVAGFEPGFPAPLMWVGTDNAVYRLNGYSEQRVSTSHLEWLISQEDGSDLEASVYVAAGHPCWVLTGPSWTFVYDMSTGFWHERHSYETARWRASFGVQAFNEWLVFDRTSGQVYRVDPSYRREDTDPLIFELRSVQQHRFPGRAIIDSAAFDFVTGVGSDTGIAPIETEPRVSIDWSDDGGIRFGAALLRDLGTQGEHKHIEINRCGMTGRTGRQWRLRVSDPVESVFMGASMQARGVT